MKFSGQVIKFQLAFSFGSLSSSPFASTPSARVTTSNLPNLLSDKAKMAATAIGKQLYTTFARQQRQLYKHKSPKKNHTVTLDSSACTSSASLNCLLMSPRTTQTQSLFKITFYICSPVNTVQINSILVIYCQTECTNNRDSINVQMFKVFMQATCTFVLLSFSTSCLFAVAWSLHWSLSALSVLSVFLSSCTVKWSKLR